MPRTNTTAIPSPREVFTFFETAIKVHIPRKKARAMFSMNTVFIKMLSSSSPSIKTSRITRFTTSTNGSIFLEENDSKILKENAEGLIWPWRIKKSDTTRGPSTIWVRTTQNLGNWLDGMILLSPAFGLLGWEVELVVLDSPCRVLWRRRLVGEIGEM